MPTIKLVPSAYTNSSTNTSYISVTNPSNMYHDTSHTANYATIKGRNSNSTYYCLVHGFDFTQVPNGAIVNSFTVRIKAYESNCSTSSSYRIRLASSPSNSNDISGTTVGTSLSTSTQTLTIPTGNLDWATIKSYGSDFSVDIPIRRSGSGTPYIYVYGIEIEVDYTEPTPRNIDCQVNGNGTINPQGTTTVSDGDSFTLQITPDDFNDTVTCEDNGIDVTSQLVRAYDDALTISTASGASYGFNETVYNGVTYWTALNKGIDKSVAVVQLDFTMAETGSITIEYINYAEATYDYMGFGKLDTVISKTYNSNWSSSATTFQKLCYQSSDNSANVQTLTYSNISAGNHYIQIGYKKDDATTSNLDLGYFRISATSGIQRTYHNYYLYTIRTVNADHNIVVNIGGSQPSTTNYWFKVNGNWQQVATIYVKRSGTWRQVDKMFTKINGNWQG